MIHIQDVTKRFGRFTAVDGVSIDIPEGDSVALWGGNGAGKTTLIRCVLGLLRFRGEIRIGGHDARREGKRARRLIGYVPQELGFYDDLRVGAAVGFFARLKRVSVDSVDEVLGSVGLAGQQGKRIRELSGGMKQRLALAIAMLGDPPVLVLDEVTASLDACGREEFVALLSRLCVSGRTMLFASHRVDEVASLSRRVVTLERGRVTGIVPSQLLASQLGVGASLHVTIAKPARELAIIRLRECGFDPRMNGVGLIIPIQPEHKAAPFRVLAEARITVDDFELLAAGTQPRHGETHA